MKRLLYYLMAAFLLTACFPDIGVGPSLLEEGLEGQPVLVEFSVPGDGVTLTTKAGEEGDIGEADHLDPNRFYLVVCGHSQSIKYIRKAELKGTTTVPVTDIPEWEYPLSDRTGTVTMYNFKAQLELSDSDRTIHFLGNIDENQLITGSYSYQVLPSLLSGDGKQAYWQSVYLSKILPKRDENYNPVMENGFFVLDDNLADSLRFIPLIRNYAKVRLNNRTSNFELQSYAVVYQPRRGSVVPYHAEADKYNRFIFPFTHDYQYQFSGYEKNSAESLEQMGYAGNQPAGIELDDTVPDAAFFEHPENSGGRVIEYHDGDETQGFYMFERGVPTNTVGPTYVILRGRFTDGEIDYEHSDGKGYYYYRLDLMETRTVGDKTISSYYPIYRNFWYEIDLWRIASVGVSSPLAAVNSSGAEDISADRSMRHLSDISNGTTRLVVEPYMAQTFTEPKQNGFYELYVRFFDNVASATPDFVWGTVTVELEPMEDGGSDILQLYDELGNKQVVLYPPADPQSSPPGIRTVRFNTVEPGDVTRTQKIKITGQIIGDAAKKSLYREVEISLQKKQAMSVVCDPAELSRVEGAKMTLNITIPTGMPESMFPLAFVIEAENLTLTPDNSRSDNNIPVQYGPSLSGSGKPAFQFVRTLTWEEYSQSNTFKSYFKSNRSECETTIWVDNKFFNLGKAVLKNRPLPTNHFYVYAEEDCVVRMTKAVKYKMDGGEWQSCEANTDIEVEAGHTVSFSSSVLQWGSGFSCTAKGSSGSKDGKFKVGGNLAALLVGDRYEDSQDLTGYSFNSFFKGHTGLSDASALEILMTQCPNSCFRSMFEGCTSLTQAPPSLPATTLGSNCYENMFYGCTALVTAPSSLPATTMAASCYRQMYRGCTSLAAAPSPLPAMTLANNCYESMFNGCTNLSSAPALPATALATACYKAMFSGCTALSAAPALPATTVAASCYENMFYNCSILNSAPALPATTLEASCYKQMFYNCKALATAPALPATTLAVSCYEGMFNNCIFNSAPALPATTLAASCYKNMFSSCKKLTTPPALPATTLADSCYVGMFKSCEILETAPDLPATTLAKRCYKEMFYNCNNRLATAPALPAETLADSCYMYMFGYCKKLTAAPALPATTLAASCYESMFYYCTALASAPALPATTLTPTCYKEMFRECTSLVTAPDLPAETLATECYHGMFRKCTKLTSLKCYINVHSGEGHEKSNYDRTAMVAALNKWMVDINTTGTIYCHPDMVEYWSHAKNAGGGWYNDYNFATIPGNWSADEWTPVPTNP